jgi:hypothetical protein
MEEWFHEHFYMSENKKIEREREVNVRLEFELLCL